MEYLDYFKILQRDIHSVVFATNDGDGHLVCPNGTESRSICLNADIKDILAQLQ